MGKHARVEPTQAPRDPLVLRSALTRLTVTTGSLNRYFRVLTISPVLERRKVRNTNPVLHR